MPDQFHISSLVVHSTPQRVQRVSEAIALMPGARVYGSSLLGKVVVTLDADSIDQMMERVLAIQRTDGVLSAALVYEYTDTVDATTEELPDVR